MSTALHSRNLVESLRKFSIAIVNFCIHITKWNYGIPAILGLMILHLLFLWCFFEPAISTPDANGYLAQARLIAELGRSDIVMENPAQYVGDHWMKVAEGHYFGQYPPGLPALLAVVYRLISPTASLWVIPAMGTLSLLPMFLIIRQWLGSGWGIFAATLMMLNPYANAHALGADSHTAVCFFLLWGLYGLIMWESKKSMGWAMLSGFCLGMIPTIRYAEALFLLAAALFVVMTWKKSDGFQSLLAGTLAALVPITAIAIRNQNAFGAFWRTGYSVSGEQTGFALSYFVRFSIPYLIMIFGIGSFACFVIGIRGLVTMCQSPETRKRGILLTSLVLPISLLCFAYYFPANPKSMRFFLPTFYIYAIAATLYVAQRTQADAANGERLAKRLFLLNLVWGLPLTLMELSPLKRDNRELAQITRELQSEVASQSILVAQSGILQHLDFVGGWHLAPEEAFYRKPRPDRPLGPETFGPGRDLFHNQSVSDEPSQEQRSEMFRKQLGDWAGSNRKIYVLTSRQQCETLKRQFNGKDQFLEQAEINVNNGRRPGPPGFNGPGAGPPDRDRPEGKEQGRPGGFFFRLFGPPMPPPGFEREGGRQEPRKKRRGPAGGGFGPPARYRPPEGGKLILMEWKINQPD